MDISICIPVYNVEPYLKRCLDSLFSQEFEGTFEVICVDDASTDNSLSILKDYQLKEPRLKVMKLAEKKKISVVRSSAICAASGSYIMQVDSDDWLQQGALSSLYQKSVETNADIIVYDYVVENDLKKQITHKHFEKERFVKKDESCIQEIFSGASVCKMVKSCLVSNLLFCNFDISWGDDFLFNTEILLKAETIYLFPFAFYVYCTNHSSITFSIKKNENEMLEDRITSVEATVAILGKYSASDKLKLSLLNYHIYKLLVLLLRVDKRNYERNVQLKRLADSMRNLPLMTESGYRKLCLAIKYPFYALAYMALCFDFKLSFDVFYKKYLKHE
jgi:glycosyltransferase EpsH